MSRRLGLALAAGVAAAGLVLLVISRRNNLPEPGSPAYEQVATAFYHGLAALEVGLLDDARQQFRRATEIVPEEPASWANLGVAQLRLGELDAAAEPIARAAALAPDNADVALLMGRMESARGRVDEAVAHYRRAVELDPSSLRARYALFEELERGSGGAGSPELLELLDELLAQAPENLAVILERARTAARAGDAGRLRDSVARLREASRTWPAVAQEQYAALEQAAAALQGGPGDPTFVEAERRTNQLRNVLARVPAYSASLAALRTPTELIAEPFTAFLALEPPSARPAAPDMAVSFSREDLGEPASVAVAFPPDGQDAPAVFAADAVAVRRLSPSPAVWPFPGDPSGPAPSAHNLLAVDWNHDFLIDLVLAGPRGVRILQQQAGSVFQDVTDRAGGQPSCAGAPASAAGTGCTGVWAADIDMEGDVDLVVAGAQGPVTALRNNGDGTWRELQPFPGIEGARSFAWADLDRDADPDAAVVDRRGRLHVLINEQGGTFRADPALGAVERLLSIAPGDVDADGAIDLVMLDDDGVIRRASRRAAGANRSDAEWELSDLASGSDLLRVLLADIDNNGALDVVGSGRAAAQVWLADEQLRLQRAEAAPSLEVFSIVDLNADGRLDLVGVSEGRAVRFLGAGTRPYHWKVIRPRAQQNAGDQRINSMGIGGEVEVRAGLLTQKQVLSGGPVHVGLGTRTTVDVVRIVWPNGVAQAEFGVEVDGVLVAEQRLKGSCPWVFAWNGTSMSFVTDFLWRSPLGLRINAQDTAGISQTEDWIRIGGDQLAGKEGHYDIRITAELWETHFFDHVSLLVVDHPADTDVFVDERFLASRPPALAVHAVRGVRPVPAARDHRGTDVSAIVQQADGRHLASFELGRYQGVAQEHAVELDLDAGVAASARPVLLARGWIYPTDSSINVAIAQGAHPQPRGISLEVQDGRGRWAVVERDLGFPAGKNKTMVIDLRGVRHASRIRLRTNLEVYWDALMLAEAVDAPVRSARLQPSTAELAFRGYSITTSPRGDAPETPRYDRVANITQRWRDLEGYYTRYGDVKELLERVDDRYVIMNAGDELRLRFPEQPAAVPGWRRDFVLIGDGWEKDGDYNTAYSQGVLPLPSHADATYGARGGSAELEDDPVYQRHARDWERYHTRYVRPDRFVQGLR